MKERPVLFSGEMVRAILEDRKWKTRRVVKPQPDKDAVEARHFENLLWYFSVWNGGDSGWHERRECPYGAIGDRLWVRETWSISGNWEDTKISDLPKFALKDQLVYRATEKYPDAGYYKWRPSIFMPRWASRLLLEIVNVHVERVQDISFDDAIAEGAYNGDPLHPFALYDFHMLWDKLNATRGFGWNINPWVWVIEFKRLKPVTISPGSTSDIKGQEANQIIIDDPFAKEITPEHKKNLLAWFEKGANDAN